MTADEMRELQWVKPKLVAQIRFVEWTAEGRLSHAAFLGLRFGKERARGAPGSEREHLMTVSVRLGADIESQCSAKADRPIVCRL